MQPSKACSDIVKLSEGLRLTAYLCPAGVPTIGYGSTHGVTMRDVETRRKISMVEAEHLLSKELDEFGAGVLKVCKIKPTQSQLDAMTSLAFNIGLGAFAKSSVLRAHNRGDSASASRAFNLWNKARVNGVLKQLPGLVKRRALEAALYLRDEFIEDPMPQEVEPESRMSMSTINRAASFTGGTATLAAVADAVDTTSSIKNSIEGLGQWVVPILAVAVVALAGYIIWERSRQRKDGWA